MRYPSDAPSQVIFSQIYVALISQGICRSNTGQGDTAAMHRRSTIFALPFFSPEPEISSFPLLPKGQVWGPIAFLTLWHLLPCTVHNLHESQVSLYKVLGSAGRYCAVLNGGVGVERVVQASDGRKGRYDTIGAQTRGSLSTCGTQIDSSSNRC